MAEPITIEKFIEANYQRHDYEIGPDDDPRQSNYIRKDGSYQIVSPTEIAKEYASEIQRANREEALRANAEKNRLELRLAEALRAIEVERQARTVDRTKVAELKKQVKGFESSLSRLEEDAGTLGDIDTEFKKLRKDDVAVTASKVKEVLEKQLGETVQTADMERPATMRHRMQVMNLQKRLDTVQADLKQIADDTGTLVTFGDALKKQRREDAVIETTKLKDILNRQLSEALQAVEQEKPASAMHRKRIVDIKERLKGIRDQIKKLSDD